jgi:hypothetical protein
MGLDVADYDQTVADPGDLERMRADRDDGIALGVPGTPTFFVNGVRLQPRTADDLRAALDAPWPERVDDDGAIASRSGRDTERVALSHHVERKAGPVPG